MSRQYLDDITLDIANSYAALTNRDSNWVNHLSISDFVEIRRQAIFEIENNFSSTQKITNNQVKEKELSKENNKQVVEIVPTKPVETPPQKTIERPIVEKQTTKEDEIKETFYNKEKEKEKEKEIEIKTPKEDDKNNVSMVENIKQEEPKVFDKKHDQEELDLFSRLKD